MEAALPQPIPSAAAVEPEVMFDAADLTHRMARGEEAAYRAFFAAYFSRLLGYLLVLTRGREQTAQEALQRTLLRVARNIKPFASEAAFWSWLTVLARSSLVDEHRRESRYLAFLDRFLRVHDPLPSAPADAQGQLLGLLESQVRELPEPERRIVEMKYFERLPVARIAAEAKTTAKAVESRLARIRMKLKQAVLASLSRENEK